MLDGNIIEMQKMIEAIVGIPVDSVGAGGGTELTPNALRGTGLIQRLGGEDCGDLPVQITGTERDPTTGIVAYASVVRTVHGVRTGLARVLPRRRRVLLLGGCCSVVPGILAALADTTDGSIGLAYLDGHLDLHDGYTSPTGEAADMPLAQALGHGDPAIIACGPVTPLIQPDALALLAFRDLEEASGLASLLPEDLSGDPLILDAAAVRNSGTESVGVATAERLAARCAAYHLHIDVDVLSSDAFPATPAQQDGGLTITELITLARPLATHPACHSIGIHCYDPELDDRDRTNAHTLADALIEMLTLKS